MLDAKMKERLNKLSTPLVTDAMDQFGLDGMVDTAIRPVVPFTRVIGTAVTVKFESVCCKERASLSHYLEAMTFGKDLFDPMLVLELPADSLRYGILGEGTATSSRSKGFVGAVVDGGVRDSHDLKAMGFPVFARKIAMGFIVGRVATVSMNEPVTIGGIRVEPGDTMFADNDGVLVIPQGRLAELVDRAEAIQDWEHRFHAFLAQGKSFEEVPKLAGPMPGTEG